MQKFSNKKLRKNIFNNNNKKLGLLYSAYHNKYKGHLIPLQDH